MREKMDILALCFLRGASLSVTGRGVAVEAKPGPASLKVQKPRIYICVPSRRMGGVIGTGV